MAQMLPSIGEKRPKMPVFTVEDCSQCGTKTKRAFKNGDYIFKESGNCPKCNSKTLITAIYAELVKVQ